MSSRRDAEVHTYRWQVLRSYIGQMIPCACSRCGETVNAGDEWDLDHLAPSVWGGTAAAGLGVAHRSCNRRHGQAIAESRKALNRLTDSPTERHWPPPSRDW